MKNDASESVKNDASESVKKYAGESVIVEVLKWREI